MGLTRVRLDCCTTIMGLALFACSLAAPAAAQVPAPVVYLEQGKNWSEDARSDFYSRDQGSRIMPLRWMKALKQPSGSAFLEDSLSRYGYLPNKLSSPPGLPVGFTVASTDNGEVIGMTCAACHTRQINVGAKRYRIDGGPAIVDFQSFLADLDVAMGAAISDPARFLDFAHVVLGPSTTANEVATLRTDVQSWYLPYHTLIERALPKQPWGPGRLDAVSMIFNRLSGLDLGPAPTYMIPDNIQRADAPVRYPFLWNAARQDKTQWPGFADNGNAILGLARNLGEVTGVFAVFHPSVDDSRLLGINYVHANSANFQGLDQLERLVRKIGPPKWPGPIDTTLANKGAQVYKQNCAACHGIKHGEFRSLPPKPWSWATPIKNVHTDTREYTILERLVDPGVLAGAEIPGVLPPLKNPSLPKDLLGLAVTGAIIQHAAPLVLPGNQRDLVLLSQMFADPEVATLRNAFHIQSSPPPKGSYEARVLEGIWAAAPYLHNGSVPTLAELLKPASERIPAFRIGPEYDLANVGLAVSQTVFTQTMQSTGCDNLDSGNSRCGHEYGTELLPAEKKALLEYLKKL
jgi:hypothetical protein